MFLSFSSQGTPQSLSILTWVLGTLSLIGLIITWIVFTCNRSENAGKTPQNATHTTVSMSTSRTH